MKPFVSRENIYIKKTIACWERRNQKIWVNYDDMQNRVAFAVAVRKKICTYKKKAPTIVLSFFFPIDFAVFVLPNI